MKPSKEQKRKNIQNSIKIFIRMRPLLNQYQDQDAWSIQKQSKSVISLQKPVLLSNLHLINNLNDNFSMMKRRYADAYYNYKFNYDNVFGPEDHTEKVYQQSTKQLVKSVIKGYNCTVFLYGQTTSGKTYTMLGDQQTPGILMYSLNDVFQEIQSLKQNGNQFQIQASYLEIYNQQINDLLAPGSVNLKIHEDAQHGINVQGLKSYNVETFQAAICLMKFGQQQRMYKSKHIHDHSSRSHTIFQLKIKSNKTNHILNSCLLIQQEARDCMINSLDMITLMKQVTQTKVCLYYPMLLTNWLRGKKSIQNIISNHIPYRDSKLTRFLSNSLGGNSMTTIICTISPAAMNFYQTLSTLRFATRAKKIYNKPIINQTKSKQSNKQLQEMRLVLSQRNEQIQILQYEKAALQKQIEQTTIPCGQNKKSEGLIQIYNNIQKILYQKYQPNQHHKIKRWENKSKILIQEFQENIMILQQKYKKALMNLTQKEFPNLSSSPVKDYPNNILQKIQSGKIFNDLYVNSILNPENDIYLTQQQEEQYLKQVSNAYQQAIGLLKNKYQQYKKYSLGRDKINRLNQLYSKKMIILQSAYEDVIRKIKF